MKKFRKIWDGQTNGFLLDNREMRSDYRAYYAAFMERFPESGVTMTAFKNQVSRLGIADRGKSTSFSRKPRPLYSEHVKKGYVRIKVAQPNEWMMKSKWVYMETHPWEDFSERSNYVFLDGDNRNFSPDNIGRVPIRMMSNYAREAARCGTADERRLALAKVKLRFAMLDRGEELGLVADYNRKNPKRKSRVFRSEAAARRKAYIAGRKEREKELRDARYRKMMADPVLHERHKAYVREQYRKRMEKRRGC